MIVHRQTKEHYPVDFHPLTPFDVSTMIRDGSLFSWELQFDWTLYFRFYNIEVYKMVIRGDDEIQGCIAFEVKEDHIYVHLIESAPHNFKGRAFELIGEHLFGFACKCSEDLGFEGAVAFQSKIGPKSVPLMNYYVNRIKAEHLGNGYMIIDGPSAKQLIMIYST
ncbi:hypothetical protein DFQ01_12266 [Paenibacillus cellulosilyticus]|uniref:N-acetyltransferase domain-containing protein n=1 Tax=Paenibacillus cellulosilyticus TaxID=375489 RepID=A0A2V2YNT4_9BACL|nr:hypothetical protein [Paenibacillus cellulosilyticus]PWV97335.1 hypothetical protein DFQ01_12266 [Paenibacillus cellulosilyticus]QKS47465.1 hypothetical protein HUB94_24065 [Paenibacillus cellulosilyticus]